MINSPPNFGVGEICGDQVAACKCYMAMMEMDDHLQTINIEVQQTVAELVERLDEILLNDSRPDQTTRIGTLASLMVR